MTARSGDRRSRVCHAHRVLSDSAGPARKCRHHVCFEPSAADVHRRRAIDFGRRRAGRTELNAAADAAVFAALTTAMMKQSNEMAQTAAREYVQWRDAAITSLRRTRPPSPSPSPIRRQRPHRNVTATYSAQNEYMFAGIFGLPTTSCGVRRRRQRRPLANINFYLLLDNSPSMALPATQAGIIYDGEPHIAAVERRLRVRLPSARRSEHLGNRRKSVRQDLQLDDRLHHSDVYGLLLCPG